MPRSRRAFLRSAPEAAAAAFLIALSSVEDELSQLASEIPFQNTQDVYYPPYFRAQWTVERDLYVAEQLPAHRNIPHHALLSRAAVYALSESVGQHRVFVAAFIRHRGRVIEDRALNVREELHLSNVVWNKDQPDDVATSSGAFANPQCFRRFHVVHRSFAEDTQGYATFLSSEYAHIVEAPSEAALRNPHLPSSPQSVYARRRLISYKVNSVDRNLLPDGMQRVVVDYIYPPSPPDAKPALLLKYRDFLVKRKSWIS